MLIIVSGLPGTGKSTLVEGIAKHYKLKKIFASALFKQLKEESTLNPALTEKGTGVWESKLGEEYLKERLKDYFLDKAVDDALLKIIEEQDNLIIDSRTMPWLSKKGFKIWLTASEEVRAKRIAKRDNIDWKVVKKMIRKRLNVDKKIYKKLYGFKFGTDLKVFDLVINTDNLDEREVFNITVKAINKKFKRISH